MGEKDLQVLGQVFGLAIKLISQDQDVNGMKNAVASVISLEQKTLSYLQEKIAEDEAKESSKKDGKNNK